MKKFLKKTEGFTLVELIVVIAILGILAGVGTVGYSGYIKKANMAADRQLVSQVANALQLHYYADPTNAKSDYVILKVNADAEDGGKTFADAAMKAAFGDEWKKTAKLMYDGWEVSNVLPSVEDAAKVANSSYYQNSTPAELVSSFTGLTDALAGMANTASQDPLDTMKSIGVMTDAEYTAMSNKLTGLGLSWSSEAGANNIAYTTAVSNLLVQNVSTEIGTNQYTGSDDETPSAMAELAMSYALIYGWASTDAEGAEILSAMNAKVSDPNSSSSDVVDAVMSAMDAAGGKDGFKTYMTENGQSSNDLSALGPIMGTVSKWSDGVDMTTPGLYSSNSITNAVNNYITAVGAMSGMEEPEANALAAALGTGVVVYVSSDGTVGYNISLG